ncbi:hypothetical protein [Polluticaenibacter yanchengensis]|uniref:Uncharacterized protein n=1 Tax=Polluticaenibacter yanchengensis TaxID=3014562 RepID=A0ABT4UPU1_9BACT|nr:hypothetical protein [Chitinophagaceae bacterium LY-5]
MTWMNKVMMAFLVVTMVYACDNKKGKASMPATTIMNIANDSINTKYKKLLSDGADAYIKALNDFDWFIEKTDPDKEKILKRIKSDLSSYTFLALSDLHFDAEGFENAEAYKLLILDVIKLTNTREKIDGLIVTQDTDFINISVTTRENKALNYAIDLRENQDWLDDAFFEKFINNSLLKETNSLKRCFFLPGTDQTVYIIVASPTSFLRAKASGLIPEESYFIE